MRGPKDVVVGLLAALLLPFGATRAGTDLNEVGALLVYPLVAAFQLDTENNDPTTVTNDGLSTIVTVTNAGGNDAILHLALIDGQSMRGNPFTGDPEPNPNYCNECDFFVALSPADTEVLVIKAAEPNLESHELVVDIISIDTGIAHSCNIGFGMLVVSLEDENAETYQSNILLGDAIVVDESNAWAHSIPAITFQGKNQGDSNHRYRFDDQEYGKLPRIVAADFIAPDAPGSTGTEVTAELVLFTLGFWREYPPVVDCSVTGFDASEHPFSRSVRFGCWEWLDLADISSEFIRGNLGAGYCDASATWSGQFEDDASVYCDEHGWLSLNCRVDSEPDGNYEIQGGVHGAIVQTAVGPLLDRAGTGFSTTPDAGAWARLLYQSVTTGSSLELRLTGRPVSLLP